MFSDKVLKTLLGMGMGMNVTARTRGPMLGPRGMMALAGRAGGRRAAAAAAGEARPPATAHRHILPDSVNKQHCTTLYVVLVLMVKCTPPPEAPRDAPATAHQVPAPG